MALRRNILLFHQGALGDFVVTWPLALGLARAFAQSRVFYVTHRQKGLLAERALRVESVDVEGGWHQMYSDSPRLPEPAARLLAGSQWIVHFVAAPEERCAHNARALAGDCGIITLSTNPPADDRRHITQFMLEQLHAWPVIEAAMAQMLGSIASRGLMSPRPTGGAVVLHPGAGSDAKCWPAQQFLHLARHLHRAGRSVRILLGEVERERWPLEQQHAFAEVAEVHQPLTLVELYDQLLKAAAFVGNDSGPGHLAGMLGVPTLSIFGPRDPSRWKPIGPRVHTLCDSWEAITADRVFAAMQELN